MAGWEYVLTAEDRDRDELDEVIDVIDLTKYYMESPWEDQ